MRKIAAEDPPRVQPCGPAAATPRFLDLGAAFCSRSLPRPLAAPLWVATSPACAAELGFPADWAERADWQALRVLSGGAPWPGMAPVATLYSGHRFGAWSGQLGDRCALLLGELETPCGPREVQLKGAGRTPFTAAGDDGRLGLRSAIREFLTAEALHALGVATTRALCVTGSPLPSRSPADQATAIVTRVAPSFIRFGHFEHVSGQGDGSALQALADFAIDHFAADCRGAPEPVAALLELTAWRTAELVAAWQSVGFRHGLLHTDNMSLLGLSLDFGASAFLDAFRPGHVGESADESGRYAWGRQPRVALWNLQALGHALTPLIGEKAASDAIESYRARLPIALGQRFAAKLGLASVEPEDAALVDDLLGLMASAGADFTLTFRRLSGFRPRTRARNAAVRDLFIDRRAFDAWALRYAERLAREEASDAERAAAMNRVNPKFVLRDHLAEAAIEAATAGDFSALNRLHSILQRPFDEQPQHGSYADPPPVGADKTEVTCS